MGRCAQYIGRLIREQPCLERRARVWPKEVLAFTWERFPGCVQDTAPERPIWTWQRFRLAFLGCRAGFRAGARFLVGAKSNAATGRGGQNHCGQEACGLRQTDASNQLEFARCEISDALQNWAARKMEACAGCWTGVWMEDGQLWNWCGRGGWKMEWCGTGVDGRGWKMESSKRVWTAGSSVHASLWGEINVVEGGKGCRWRWQWGGEAGWTEVWSVERRQLHPCFVLG